MNQKRFSIVFSLLIIAALLLGASGSVSAKNAEPLSDPVNSRTAGRSVGPNR